jgi:arabinose-5-phosphate isomerase
MSRDPEKWNRVFNMAIIALGEAERLTHTTEFDMFCDKISNKRVWCIGMGKAGLPASKLASSLASNGTPAAFLHVGDCLHGDLGAVQRGDVVVAFSNSGKTVEVIQVADKLKVIGAELLLITGESDSELSKLSDVALCYGKIREACPLGLTPTTSITVMMVLSDAIVIRVQEIRGLTYEQYSVFHHAGYLGSCAREKSEIGRS